MSRRRKISAGALIPLLLLGAPLRTADAVELGAQDTLHFTRADLFLRNGNAAQAVEELDEMRKETYEAPPVHRTIAKAFEELYANRRQWKAATVPHRENNTAQNKIRVTRRREDASRNSDQSFDERGWQANEHYEADVEGKDGLRGRFVVDLDGFKDGHNDLRYRTLLADFYEGTHHFAAGDSATFTSPYFLRGSRLRGIDLLLVGESNEFQAVAGAYPYWLEDRDEYIYPRTVFGIRDRVHLMEDRFRFGANLVNTRDTGKIRTIDTANQNRDNTVFSLDQEFKLIPNAWSLKAAEAYSVTDDLLEENRFGENIKLKDSAFRVESLMISRYFRSTTLLERTGPDFRMLLSIPTANNYNAKGFTSDRQLIEEALDLRPIGPFDLDFSASWIRNNLDHDDTLEHTRQAWCTADLGILTPRSWPKPRVRGTFMKTISSPGSTTRPSHSETYDVDGELYRNIWTVDTTAFANYELEHPVKDRETFDEEEAWGWGLRLARPLGTRVLLNSRYKYLSMDKSFDEVRGRAVRQEGSVGGSLRLWSMASLGLNYTYLHGKVVNQGLTRLSVGRGHSGTATFTWPYTLTRWDKRRKFTFSPGLTYHLTAFNDDLEDRPLFAGRLSLGYELYPDWRVELAGEFRFDHDVKRQEVRTQGSRIWLLWTSHFGET